MFETVELRPAHAHRERGREGPYAAFGLSTSTTTINMNRQATH